ncbi:MAG: hypothetical protein CBARDMAM_7044 [uncultured Caballeronia sp.]|nr:MAG: hypothetical protein CBARDMAM_7044 [uncultured Caballeronia sp.]
MRVIPSIPLFQRVPRSPTCQSAAGSSSRTGFITTAPGAGCFGRTVEASGYGTAETLVATAANECSPYNIVRAFRPLGREVRDDFLYRDTDGTAYFLAASCQDGGANDSMAIFRLTDDYTDVDASAGTHWVFEHHYRSIARRRWC